MSNHCTLWLAGIMLVIAMPAAAQNSYPQQRVARSPSSAGQNRQETMLDVRPLERIQSRISNRIQNRVSSRGEYATPIKQGNRGSSDPQ